MKLMKQFFLAANLFAAVAVPFAQAALPEERFVFPKQVAPVTQLMVRPSSFHAAHTSHLDAPAMAPLIQAAGVVLEYVRPMAGRAHVLKLPHPMHLDEAQAIASRLVDSGVALIAEPDRRVYPVSEPNDPYYWQQWHYHSLVTGRLYGRGNYGINLPAAWDITTGNGTIVAVIDTGLVSHEDIDAGRVLPGYDFISDIFTANDGDGRDADPSDPGDWVTEEEAQEHRCLVQNSSWHGTHVAGTIAATTNNWIGVAGIAPQAYLLPVRVLGKCGGWTSDIIDGIYWAAGLSVPGVRNNPYPAKVLNLSLGGEGECSRFQQEAINAALSAGATVVVAAGNDAADASNYNPANCSGVITVAATDKQGQRAYYSNFGSAVTLSAPGGDGHVDTMILSTSNIGTTVTIEGGDTYVSMQGTSMATPHVSGIAALMYAVNPDLTSTEVRDALRATATPFPSYKIHRRFNCTTDTCGAGIAQANWAVLAAVGEDFVPDAFSFAPQNNVPLGATVTSEPVTISGLGHQTHISVRGGEYSIDCDGNFTSVAGVISNGQSVCVRHTSAATFATAVTTTVTIGGVSGEFTSTTTSTP